MIYDFRLGEEFIGICIASELAIFAKGYLRLEKLLLWSLEHATLRSAHSANFVILPLAWFLTLATFIRTISASRSAATATRTCVALALLDRLQISPRPRSYCYVD